MPLYEYLCESCGRTSEVLQRLADPPIDACPHCGGKVKKQTSAPAFHLKGSGWYATDYGKKGGGEGSRSGTASNKSDGGGASEGAAAAEGAGAAKSESASESSPAAKAEPKSESKGGDARD